MKPVNSKENSARLSLSYPGPAAWAIWALLVMFLISEEAGASMVSKVTATDVQHFTVYHSPQTPGYTCWVGCWLMPDGTLMVSFHQATGPLSGRPRVRKDIQKQLNWPRSYMSPEQQAAYDMTGTIQQIIHLASTDGGHTWEQVSAEPFHTPANGITCKAEVALPDGTIVRGVRGSNLPFYDVPQTAYVQHSSDGGQSWGPPQVAIEPDRVGLDIQRLGLLSDGRLVALCNWGPGVMLISTDGGYTWSEPMPTWPPDHEIKVGERDLAELPDGRLLVVVRIDRRASGWTRGQSLLEPEGDSFGLVSAEQAPFPHSGQPELLAAQEGVVLYLATTGIHWTADAGKSWHDLGIGGTGYYPRSVQLPDGRIFCVYHRGGDNSYDGSVDQEIQAMTFRLKVE